LDRGFINVRKGTVENRGVNDVLVAMKPFLPVIEPFLFAQPTLEVGP
jgi:hypothetical protein